MKRKAFTLIELLVVIAVLGLLAALLFPVFAHVRENGRRTTCQGNLRQLALAMQQYVQDNGGTYPPAVRYQGQNCYEEWARAVSPYAKSITLFRCPDRPRGDAQDAAVDFNQLPAYDVDYNYDLTRLNMFLPPHFSVAEARGVHEAALQTPSTLWLNRESYWSDGDDQDHHFRSVTTSCGRRFLGSDLHSGGGNYSFVDGHVKWLTPESMGETECLNGPLPFPVKESP